MCPVQESIEVEWDGQQYNDPKDDGLEEFSEDIIEKLHHDLEIETDLESNGMSVYCAV